MVEQPATGIAAEDLGRSTSGLGACSIDPSTGDLFGHDRRDLGRLPSRSNSPTARRRRRRSLQIVFACGERSRHRPDLPAPRRPIHRRIGANLDGDERVSHSGRHQLRLRRHRASIQVWTGGGFTMSSAAAAIEGAQPRTSSSRSIQSIMELEPGVGSSGSALFTRSITPPSPVTISCARPGRAIARSRMPTATAQDGPQSMTVSAYQTRRATWALSERIRGQLGCALSRQRVLSAARECRLRANRLVADIERRGAQNWRNGYAAYVPLLRAALPGGSAHFRA